MSNLMSTKMVIGKVERDEKEKEAKSFRVVTHFSC